jgi:SpoVK/Ycf46/Vps4 family AAA+-type ATPase
MLYFIQYKYNNEYSNIFFFNKDFNLDSFMNQIWDVNNNGIHFDISVDNNSIKTSFSSAIKSYPDYFSGDLEDTYQSFIKENRKYIDNKISRTHLFWGPPGTGKSIFITRAANEFGGKYLFLPSDSIIYARDLESIVENLKPKFLLIDDLDKIVIQNLSKVLNFLTQVKITNPGIIIMITANSLNFDSALKRPGRIDQKHYIGAPSDNDRLILIKQFCDSQTCSKTIDLLSKQTKGLTTASIKELCLQLNFKSIEDVLITAEELKRDLELDSFEEEIEQHNKDKENIKQLLIDNCCLN